MENLKEGNCVIWENTSNELRVESLKARFEIQKCEF